MFFDNYGKYCEGSFENIGYKKQATYKFIIYKKNYSGAVYSALCGSDPAILKFLNDDIYGIKGAELQLRLINIDNNFPASLFYTEYDDEFRIKYYVEYTEPDTNIPPQQILTRRTIFEGYLLQDDIKEILTDIGHEIELTFTDGLGLLKEISFEDAMKTSPSSVSNLRRINAYIDCTKYPTQIKSTILIQTPIFDDGNSQIGDYIYIKTDIGYFSFTIINKKIVGSNIELEVKEQIPITLSNYQTEVIYITGYNYLNYEKYITANIWKIKNIKLSEILRICLHATGLSLDLKYFSKLSVNISNLLEQNFLENTSVKIDTLKDGDNFLSCYEVLERLCKRFRFTLFQYNFSEEIVIPYSIKIGNSSWFLQRFNEYKYTNNLTGLKYTSYIVQETGSVGIYRIDYNKGEIEFGIEETITRPIKSIQDKFDYRYSDQLLFNSNLQQIGSFVNSNNATLIDYVGLKAITYSAQGFYNPYAFPQQYIFDANIQIVYDDEYISERERWLVIQPNIGMFGPNGYDGTAYNTAIYSNQIEVNKNDWIEYSFEYIARPSTSSVKQKVYIILTGKSGTFYTMQNDGSWFNGITLNPTEVDESNTVEWVSGNFKSFKFPEDGLLTISFGQYSVWQFGPITNPPKTYYRNIELKYYSAAGSKVNIVGQVHDGFTLSQIKNKEDQEIYFDTTIKNQVLGTLFLINQDGYITNLVREWSDGQDNNAYTLGDIISREDMSLRYSRRLFWDSKLLSLFKPIYSKIDPSKLVGWNLFNPNFIIHSDVNSNKWFIAGRIEINFKEDHVECDLYELYDTSEEGGNSRSNDKIQYLFKYKYK